MKIPHNFYLVLSFLLGLGLQGKGQEAVTSPHVPILPAKPEIVLACLPPAPQNWKLTESWARNKFVLTTWQFTLASRRYLEIPPLPLPGQKPKVPGVTRVMITDTGYCPSPNRLFSDPKSGTGPNQERTTLNGYPAIRIHSAEDGGDEKLMLWVKQRFIVTIIASKQEKDSVEKWAGQVNFTGLLQISDEGETKLPTMLKMSTYDELVPANTGSYQEYMHKLAPNSSGQ